MDGGRIPVGLRLDGPLREDQLPPLLPDPPEAEPEHGRQRFEEAIRSVMRAVPDSHWTVTDLLTDGYRVAARTTWTGTYQAPMFRGITIPAPARFSVEHVHIYRIAEGTLIEHWVVRDDLTMLRQLGALPNQSSSD